MRARLPEKIEIARVRGGPMGSHPTDGANGMFELQGPCGEKLRIVASDGDSSEGWEHVSVSTRRRTPNWTEMCFVKNLFWGDDECVVQFHPRKDDYVNNHQFCLHLWRQRSGFPTPPAFLVGVKGLGVLTPAEAEAVRILMGYPT